MPRLRPTFALFPYATLFEHLADSVASHRGLDGVLYVGHIDPIARCPVAIDDQVEIGLADDAEESQILDAANAPHHVDDFVALLLERFQVGAVDLDGQLALHAAYGFFHVVRNRLRKIPEHARDPFEFPVHGRDQFHFVLVKHRPPVIFRLQIDKILRIEEPRSIGAIVGTAHLRDHLRDLREGCQYDTRLVHQPRALRRSGAGRQCAARPDGAFVEMREKLGANQAAGRQPDCGRHAKHGDTHGRPPCANGPTHCRPVAGGHPRQRRDAPAFSAGAQKQTPIIRRQNMAWTKTRIAALAGLVLLLLIAAAILVLKWAEAPPEETTAFVSQPIDDALWVNLDRRRSDKYREQLKSAPQVLVVRETHYPVNPTNGMGAHYGWLDGKMANLHIPFSELVGYAYGSQYARTEFPDKWTRGQLTNKFDVIVTLTNHAQEAMQAAARRFLRQQFGLAWHPEK